MAAGLSGQTAPTGAVRRGLGSDKLSDGDPPTSLRCHPTPLSVFHKVLFIIFCWGKKNPLSFGAS